MSVVRLAAFVALYALIQSRETHGLQDTHLHRQTRAVCTTFQHRCKNGQCISSESLCDGLVDCRDGSDETEAECAGPDSPSCNPRTFRCSYGACVDGDAPCNGIKDCADNSDETLSRCGNNEESNTTKPVCRGNQFTCDNGQCIDSTLACDGNMNCIDKSDETIELCGHFSCTSYTFRCNYGACIDKDKKCDGVPNCADGSDEDITMCGSSQSSKPDRIPDDPYNTNKPRPTQKPSQTRPPSPWRPTPTRPTSRPTSIPPLVKESCEVPPQPENGVYEIERSQCGNRDHCSVPNGVGYLEPGTQLVYSCNEGYKINDTKANSANVFCGLQGLWSHFPKCVEIRCPAINSAEREARCSYGDTWVSCDSPVVPGTSAQLSCRNSYTQDTSDLTKRDNIRCNRNGEWEPKPIKCVSVCGIAATGSGTPLIVNGKPAATSEFPWHGTLYKTKGDQKQFICGATIIKDNLLVTAAHCVYNEVRKQVDNPSKFFIAVGNIFRDYNYQFHDLRVVKKTAVKRIFTPCNYLGLEGNYASDIAILEIERAFVFSALLMPICLETNAAGDQSVLELGNYGRVAGFGRTAKGDSSFILQAITVPYVPLNVCKSSSIASDSERYITIDKFCAGYSNGSSVCDGDSGGGLVFKTNNHWYLRGIVSVGIGSTTLGAVRTCDSYAYSLYTRVSSHIEWIQDVILRLETNKPFPICS